MSRASRKANRESNRMAGNNKVIRSVQNSNSYHPHPELSRKKRVTELIKKGSVIK